MTFPMKKILILMEYEPFLKGIETLLKGWEFKGGLNSYKIWLLPGAMYQFLALNYWFVESKCENKRQFVRLEWNQFSGKSK